MSSFPGRFGPMTCPDCQTECVRASPNQRRCPPCRTVKQKRVKRANYLRTAELQRAQRRARYQANRDQELSSRRQARYGINDEELRELIAAQDGECPVCVLPLHPDDLALDHSHETGALRGVLHGSCNAALGLLVDDPVRCDRAAEYLRREVAHAFKTVRPELLATREPTTCTECGRVGVRGFRPRGDGSARCLNVTMCRRRADRQARGAAMRGRPRSAASL